MTANRTEAHGLSFSVYQHVEPSAMQLAVQAGVMVGDDVARGQRLHPGQAGGNFFRAAVEEKGRQPRTRPRTGEKIAGEQEIETPAVIRSVRRCGRANG